LQPINLLLLTILLSLQYALWLGDKNVFDLNLLKKTVESVKLENKNLSQRNDKLLSEVIDLKEGGETVETLARSQLGMIKEGETFYQIIE